MRKKRKRKSARTSRLPKRKGYTDGPNRYKIKPAKGLDLKALERAKRDWLW